MRARPADPFNRLNPEAALKDEIDALERAFRMRGQRILDIKGPRKPRLSMIRGGPGVRETGLLYDAINQLFTA